ncbi:MAG: hypothetical protein L0027_15510 [Candidatus Rokubacteria bacterium]|nr:hypothetical protein [Candidatus Rokubacteria bacterium]
MTGSTLSGLIGAALLLLWLALLTAVDDRPPSADALFTDDLEPEVGLDAAAPVEAYDPPAGVWLTR